MNNKDILNNYHVVITTPVGYPFYNRIDTLNEIMSCVLEFCHNLYRAKALVDSVTLILNASDEQEAEFYTNSFEVAKVTKTNTMFYGDSDAYDSNPGMIPDFSIPTSDFLVIAQAWLDYLVKSPTTPTGPPYPPATY